jgi:hypothetical protein
MHPGSWMEMQMSVVTSCMVAYSWGIESLEQTKFKPKYAALFQLLIHNFWL